jgi:PPE-repeat protein
MTSRPEGLRKQTPIGAAAAFRQTPAISPVKLGGSGIKLRLGQSAVPAFASGHVAIKSKPKPKAPTLSQVFNAESSDSDEEVPPEARMKMRNVGRETITSSGPNSFGKTSKGFTDCNRLFERKLQDAMDAVSNDNKDRINKLK